MASDGSARSPVLHRFGIRLGLEVIGVEASRDEHCPIRPSTGGFDEHLGAIWNKVTKLRRSSMDFICTGRVKDEAGLAWGWAVVSVRGRPSRRRLPNAEDARRRAGIARREWRVDSRRILNRLSEHGYEGPITAEPFAKCRSIDGLAVDCYVRLVAAALRGMAFADWLKASSGWPPAGLDALLPLPCHGAARFLR